jgi:hypothetical protein
MGMGGKHPTRGTGGEKMGARYYEYEVPKVSRAGSTQETLLTAPRPLDYVLYLPVSAASIAIECWRLFGIPRR